MTPLIQSFTIGLAIGICILSVGFYADRKINFMEMVAACAMSCGSGAAVIVIGGILSIGGMWAVL